MKTSHTMCISITLKDLSFTKQRIKIKRLLQELFAVKSVLVVKIVDRA